MSPAVMVAAIRVEVRAVSTWFLSVVFRSVPEGRVGLVGSAVPCGAVPCDAVPGSAGGTRQDRPAVVLTGRAGCVRRPSGPCRAVRGPAGRAVQGRAVPGLAVVPGGVCRVVPCGGVGCG
ncbi:hypothetical protein Snoj_25110 [Streptomyces nojiriensis]|uniref:Secreted protein n=1 Tax=Streptomyces nojiriensis TaxID=66374 RepID=A0ABQ3SKB2_9ACTN|nr:hypothetical protein GCM10010205_61880 [Streptomyces nojiriensis]GHI68593.1 hypothetical protein Snoj_25110 [Streptomyces nojiriensis]